MHKYQRGTSGGDTVLFWFTSDYSGRSYFMEVPVELIQRALNNKDIWCDVFDLLYRKMIEESEMQRG